MIQDAIDGYIASLRKHKEPVPSDKNTFFATVNSSDAHLRHICDMPLLNS
ncbi:hypothetical protein KKB40_00605 [Patescibacteria group bacterium]|nr:hypothetical protein [Patescibacteria group bacterium]